MSCRFAHDDAAYVLGALSPNDRLEFEMHLAGCDDCRRAVRELAGLPGLLGRVDASLLETPPVDQPVPDTLLPALSREVGRARRRRTLAAAGLAAAVAAAVGVGITLGVNQIGNDDDGGTPPASVSSTGPTGVVTRAMAPVGDVPVEADLGLEQVRWGTRLHLSCRYAPQSVEYDLPPAVDYTLFVRTREGRSEQVGSWRSVGGTTMHLAAATAADLSEIASVEVRTPDGRVVLRLRA